VIQVPDSRSYFSASFLVAGDVEGATVSGTVQFTYSDNTTSEYQLRTLNWFSFLTINRGEIILPNRLTRRGYDYNTTHIFERTAPLTPGKTLKSIRLPVKNNVRAGRLHIFSISLWQDSTNVTVQSVRPTQKLGENGSQVIEVVVNNAGQSCVRGNGLTVSVMGAGVSTVKPGRLRRLCPGDQKYVSVEVMIGAGRDTRIEVLVSDGNRDWVTPFDNPDIGLVEWTSDAKVLSKHEAPQWFNDGKYGIFIHWGPYAVTGWGNSTPYESYAEWFWWYSTHHAQGADRSDFYNYRLRTYGRNWAYDDTFPEFTASRFDPKEWVDLFADAGATYFVITTKHHDGFAIFDTEASTNRSSLHYGPRRDLLKELFSAAEKYQPSLKRGTYFSLPEWFNPDYGRYGFDQFASISTTSWPGVPAKNPYTGVEEPYTGRVPISDFISDLMVPQMEILAYKYHTDIMWCDCGAANGSAQFAAKWWNQMRAEGRQVAMYSRCGIPKVADFDTPEYQTFASAQRRKWESNRGMDPYSYGYNRATADREYMTAKEIVYSLVDIVSKNGNFLLDIGPRADGTIVQVEMDNLRQAGKWIKRHGEAIFNTTYWFIQSEVTGASDIRFTQTDDAFYILFLKKPVIQNGVIVVDAPIPAVERDKLELLGVAGGDDLAWDIDKVGSRSRFRIRITNDLLAKDEFCWVFKISYVA
jgi:alpha-L-fucosidase